MEPQAAHINCTDMFETKIGLFTSREGRLLAHVNKHFGKCSKILTTLSCSVRKQNVGYQSWKLRSACQDNK